MLSILIGLNTKISAQDKAGFKLSGQLKGLPDGTKLYLRTQERDTIARAISNGDRFTFKGKLTLDGRFHFIVIDTLVSRIGTKAIFLENQVMNVAGLVGSKEVKVTGSKAHLDYVEFVEVFSEIKDDNIKHEFLKIWISNHSESLITPWFISSLGNKEEFQKAYNLLPYHIKTSYYGDQLKRKFQFSKYAEDIKLGEIIPDFKVSLPDKKSISILEYAKINKLTLLDFWASWCKPCRAETPNMKKVYEAFHDKGFNIIGVSTDAKEVDWKKAMLEDNTAWFHGRDNLDNASKDIFGIASIPAFALVDGEGKLIAFSCAMSNISSFGPPIRGEELYKTIETLLNKKGK